MAKAAGSKPPTGGPGQLARRARPGSLSTQRTSSKSRVLLVRQPIRSVRPTDQPDRTGVRLAIATVAAVAAIVLIWSMGHLGYRLGFAEAVRVPELGLEPTGGLATGIRMLVSVPQVVLVAGIERPEWLMLGFVLIAIPAASLSAARPHTPGGPKPSSILVGFAIAGAIVSGLNSIALIWWNASPARHALLQPLPFTPHEVQRWAEQLELAAGLDVLAVVAGGLWVVLVLRLPVPLWLRVLSSSVAIFALGVATVGMSVSTATAANVHARRSICLADENPLNGMLLLGTTQHRQALLHVEGNVNLVELTHDAPQQTVVGTQSIVEFLAEQTPREE